MKLGGLSADTKKEFDVFKGDLQAKRNEKITSEEALAELLRRATRITAELEVQERKESARLDALECAVKALEKQIQSLES